MTRFSTSHLGYTITVESETAGNIEGFTQALFNRMVDLLFLSLRGGVPEAIEARTFPEPDGATDTDDLARRELGDRNRLIRSLDVAQSDDLVRGLGLSDGLARCLGLSAPEALEARGRLGSFPFTRVTSSAVAGVAYDADERILAVTYKNGRSYLYDTVPPGIAHTILEIDRHDGSVGAFLNGWVKRQYPTTSINGLGSEVLADAFERIPTTEYRRLVRTAPSSPDAE